MQMWVKALCIVKEVPIILYNANIGRRKCRRIKYQNTHEKKNCKKTRSNANFSKKNGAFAFKRVVRHFQRV
jgi:hypothetical protein